MNFHLTSPTAAPRQHPAVERDRNLESLHCSDRTGVLRHHRVYGQQRNPLDSRLCHQDPIEGILVNRWQAIDGNDVIAADRQLAVSVVQKTPAQQPRVYLKIVSAQPSFNCHFPYASRTKEKLVFRIVDQVSSLFWEPARFTGSPQEEMCIQQKLHARPPNICSISSLHIWSKSSGTEI